MTRKSDTFQSCWPQCHTFIRNSQQQYYITLPASASSAVRNCGRCIKSLKFARCVNQRLLTLSDWRSDICLISKMYSMRMQEDVTQKAQHKTQHKTRRIGRLRDPTSMDPYHVLNIEPSISRDDTTYTRNHSKQSLNLQIWRTLLARIVRPQTSDSPTYVPVNHDMQIENKTS